MEQIRQMSLSAIIAAAVASAATLYITFGGGFGRPNKRRLRGPRGMMNTGRACYMNAVLQAMASTPSILEWLREDPENILKQNLLKCLKSINRIEDDDLPSDVVTPTYLFASLRSKGFVACSTDQDAHELFQGLLEVIEIDAATSDKIDRRQSLLELRNLSDIHEATAGGGPDACETPTKTDSPGIICKSGATFSSSTLPRNFKKKSPFCGTMTSRVNYKTKKEEESPTRSNVFNNVTLYLPKNRGSSFPGGATTVTSLETLLQMFVSLEAVEESSTKQQTFARLPNCLCFHIQRTGFESGVPFKRDDTVTFPLYLNMDRFIYARQLCRKKWFEDRARSVDPEDSSGRSLTTSELLPSSKAMVDRNNYTLCAVITHIGGIQSGHYLTYRKCRLPSGRIKWYYVSDEDVKQVDVETVLSVNPYMLFYEKQPPPPQELLSPSETEPRSLNQ